VPLHRGGNWLMPSMTMRCSDCQRVTALVGEDDEEIVLEVRAFLAAHAGCKASLQIALSIPAQADRLWTVDLD
jgi:hypothetical protein